MAKTRLLGLVFGFLAVANFGFAHGQGQGATILRTTQEVTGDPRPLAAMAQIIERQLGVPVSYEDPVWEDPADLVPASEHPINRNSPQRGQLRGRAPKGGDLEVSFNIDDRTKRSVDLPETLIQDAINSHQLMKNPGRFELRKLSTGAYAIVPIEARDSQGRSARRGSPFDVRISFPEEQRDGLTTLDVILKAVSSASGVDVLHASGGLNLLPALSIKIGARDEVAREVLAKAFATARWGDPLSVGELPSLSWELGYLPDIRTYGLSLRSVLEPASSPGGDTVFRPAKRLSSSEKKK